MKNEVTGVQFVYLDLYSQVFQGFFVTTQIWKRTHELVPCNRPPKLVGIPKKWTYKVSSFPGIHHPEGSGAEIRLFDRSLDY